MSLFSSRSILTAALLGFGLTPLASAVPGYTNLAYDCLNVSLSCGDAGDVCLDTALHVGQCVPNGFAQDVDGCMNADREMGTVAAGCFPATSCSRPSDRCIDTYGRVGNCSPDLLSCDVFGGNP